MDTLSIETENHIRAAATALLRAGSELNRATEDLLGVLKGVPEAEDLVYDVRVYYKEVCTRTWHDEDLWDRVRELCERLPQSVPVKTKHLTDDDLREGLMTR